MLYTQTPLALSGNVDLEAPWGPPYSRILDTPVQNSPQKRLEARFWPRLKQPFTIGFKFLLFKPLTVVVAR